MSIFCNKCGTKNEAGAVFCESCGAPLRKSASIIPSLMPQGDAFGSTSKQASRPAPSVASGQQIAALRTTIERDSKKVLFVGGALGVLLLIGAVAAHFALKPPAATNISLLAAAKEGYGQALSAQYKRELCLSNMNYSLGTFNIAEHDDDTQTWLNHLVAAGLYSPAVPVSSGGYFPQTLMQYMATPELAKWRDGARLCVAKDVEIANVVDIEIPQEEIVGRQAKGNDANILMVKASILLQSSEPAPWLENAEIRTSALEKLVGWTYKNTRFQKQTPEIFGLRDGRWVTGPAYKAELQKNYLSNRRAENTEELASHAGPSGFLSSLGTKLSSMFSFGGHPMIGKWRLDTEAMGRSIGLGFAGGMGLDTTMNFTSNSIEVAGQSVKSKFEVVGKRVKVTPEGRATSLIFVMQDKDTALIDMGMFNLQYKRVD